MPRVNGISWGFRCPSIFVKLEAVDFDPAIQDFNVTALGDKETFSVNWDDAGSDLRARPENVTLNITGTDSASKVVHTTAMVLTKADLIGSAWAKKVALPTEFNGKTITYTAELADGITYYAQDTENSTATALTLYQLEKIVLFEDFSDDAYETNWTQHTNSSLSVWGFNNGKLTTTAGSTKVFYKNALDNFELKATLQFASSGTSWMQVLFGTDGDDSFENGEFYAYPMWAAGSNKSTMRFYAGENGSPKELSRTSGDSMRDKIFSKAVEFTLRVEGTTATITLDNSIGTVTQIFTISETHVGQLGFITSSDALNIDNVIIKDLSGASDEEKPENPPVDPPVDPPAEDVTYLLQEDFADALDSNWTSWATTGKTNGFIIDNGTLTINEANKSVNSWVWYVGDGNVKWDNYAVTLKVTASATASSSSHYGLIFNSDKDGNGIGYLKFLGTKIHLCNGTTSQASADIGLEDGKTYDVRLEVSNRQATVYVDGVEVLSHTMSSAINQNGSVGFMNQGGVPVFDDLNVIALADN